MMLDNDIELLIRTFDYHSYGLDLDGTDLSWQTVLAQEIAAHVVSEIQRIIDIGRGDS